MAKEKEKPDVRKQAYDIVRRYPGIHLREIERQTAISAPLAQYHLRKLVDEGYVDAREQGGYVRYYPTEKGRSARVVEADLPLLALLREEVPLHIALLLLDHGPMPHGELVERTGVAKSTMSYHLAKMAEAGLVERAPGTQAIRLADRERVYRLLLAYHPTPSLIDRFADLWEDLYGG